MNALNALIEQVRSPERWNEDLAAEVVRVITQHAPRDLQMDARNELLRAAARLVPGSVYAKAKRLEFELTRPDAPMCEIRVLVLRAIEVSPGLMPPTSEKQLRKIIAGGEL